MIELPTIPSAIIESLGKVRVGQCDICFLGVLASCKHEHPEWFTKVRKDPKVRATKEIERYLHEHTPVRNVFVIEDFDEYAEDSETRWCLCAEHLAALTEYMNALPEPKPNGESQSINKNTA